MVTARRQFQGSNPPSSKVGYWEVPGHWELQAGWAVLSEHSSSGAGKNSQEMTTWLHHFLAFKVRNAPAEICPSLFFAGPTILGTPRAAVELSRVKIPKKAQPQRKRIPFAKGNRQHLPQPLQQSGSCHSHCAASDIAKWVGNSDSPQPRGAHGEEEEEGRTCCLPSSPPDSFLLLSSLATSSACSCRLRLP